MATVTSTVTVNAAFLQEIKDDNRRLQDLLGVLRSAFAQHSEPADPLWIADGLEELRDQLATHFALEDAYGYFDDPVDAAPRFAHLAAELRREHGDLYLEASRLADAGNDKLRQDDWLAHWRGLRERFWRFDGQLKRHEERENRLILEALEEDIGVGD
jgi:hypothetical protein